MRIDLAIATTVAVIISACGSTPPATHSVPPLPTAVASIVPSAGSSAEPAIGTASASVSALPAVAGVPTIPMYPVIRIYSLMDVTATNIGSVEVRLGYDPGGGAMGRFRYAPIVNGAPDLEQETSLKFHADTAGGDYQHLVGSRPKLMYHQVSGFRSAAGDSYEALDATNRWQRFDPSVSRAGASGLGLGIASWSNDRLLEFRGADPYEAATAGFRLPRMRVLSGTGSAAPSLPKNLEARLSAEGFVSTTFTAFRTGEVIVVGTSAGSFGTLLWRGEASKPKYFVADAPHWKEAALQILGGDSLETVRLRVDHQVMRLSGSSWVTESTVATGELPDVWFGNTLVMQKGATLYARLAAGGPWLPIEEGSEQARTRAAIGWSLGAAVGEPTEIAVDRFGTIWKVDGDLLLSNKKTDLQLKDVTEADLVKARKASLLRGGSNDATGTNPSGYYNAACSMWYVLLDEIAETAADTKDFPKIRAILKGHLEYASARFIVSREKGRQFFGALVGPDDSQVQQLRDLIGKASKGGAPDWFCAEPAAVREVKIDLKTGAVVK